MNSQHNEKPQKALNKCHAEIDRLTFILQVVVLHEYIIQVICFLFYHCENQRRPKNFDGNDECGIDGKKVTQPYVDFIIILISFLFFPMIFSRIDQTSQYTSLFFMESLSSQRKQLLNFELSATSIGQ